MDKELLFPQFIPLHIGYWEHHADWNFPNINSPFFRMYLVVEGAATMIMSGLTYQLTPGHLYMIPPFTTHTDCCDGDFSLYYIHVFERMENRKCSLFERLSFPFEIPSSQADATIVKRIAEINVRRKLPYSDPKRYDNQTTLMQMLSQNGQNDDAVLFETCGLLLQLFSRFLAHATPIARTSNAGILKSMKHIREHIETAIRIEDLAALCCMSEDHFIRLFRNETGTTPLEYIQKKRIEKAQTMLIFSNLPIKDVAYSLSYSNLSYVIRLFRKFTGSTPGEYRNAMHRNV